MMSQGNDLCRDCFFNGCKVKGKHDIEPGKQDAGKINAKSFYGDLLQKRVLFTVKCSGDTICAK